MEGVGRVIEVWDYPVSSVGGQRVPDLSVSSHVVAGDREYALIDRVSGLPAAPEKDRRWRRAVYLQAARIRGQVPTMIFPDGRSWLLTDPSLNAHLSDYFGFATAVAVYQPGEAHAAFPLTQHRQHHFPLHLVTTASLKQLAALRQVDTIDSRRVRPTVLIDTGEARGFMESGWIGRRLRLGAVDLTAREEARRCGMTSISQPGVDEDPEILRTIVRHNRRNLGIYCSIDTAGTIRLGDELAIQD